MILEEENIDTNNVLDRNNVSETVEFKHNFINTPWDDRSRKSKFGIVSLLVAIFVVTMACVINNFIMHYKGYEEIKNVTTGEMNCFRVRMEEYTYVARIHSMSSKELLCVGAVVSPTSILTNGVCIKSGPIRVYLGSPTHPLCRKGFTVDLIEQVPHDGVISKKLALLSSYDEIEKCSNAISLGNNLDWASKIHILGRPINQGRSLSRQHVTLVKKESLPERYSMKNLNIDNMICVKDLSRCPVRAGDLLVQNGQLYGLSSTSVHRSDQNNIACFANLNIVKAELKEFDVEIE